MTLNKEIIKLGMTISEYHYDEETRRLYVSGPALEEGTWTGMNGTSTYFPRSVIHAGSHLFEGVDFACEHKGLPIGKVLTVRNTEMGFDVVEGYLTNPASIKAVLSGDKRGFSIEAAIVVDPVRRVAESIVEAINISLVETPACRVCKIRSAQLDDPCPYSKGNVAMSENIEAGDSNIIEATEIGTETEKVEETIEPVVMGSGDVTEVGTETATEEVAEDKTIGAFKELTAAAEAFKTARNKLDQILLGANIKVPVAEPEVKVEVVAQAAEVVTVEAEPEQVEVEVVTQAAPETEAEAEVVVQTIEPNNSEFEAVKFALSEAAETISSVTDKLAELTETVKTMEVKLGAVTAEAAEYKEKAEAFETELKTIQANERETLVSEIMELDPEVDTEFIGGMTVAQLSAYKGTVKRIVAKTPLAEKKSVKRDEATVELSAPTKNKLEYNLNDKAERKKFIEATLQ